MNKDLGEALEKLAEAMPPHLRDKFARDIAKAVGPEKLSQALMQTIMSNDEVFQQAVADVKRHSDMGPQLIDNTQGFIGQLRSKGKDFDECWAAMSMAFALAHPDSLCEIAGYLATWLVFHHQQSDITDTPESAAEKAKAARSVADEFLDLANVLRDERGGK